MRSNRFLRMSHIVVFTVYNHGWYASHDDIDMWAYKGFFGWALVYSYNGISKYKAKLFASDSVYDIMDKVRELTRREMRFNVRVD